MSVSFAKLLADVTQTLNQIIIKSLEIQISNLIQFWQCCQNDLFQEKQHNERIWWHLPPHTVPHTPDLLDQETSSTVQCR